MDDFQELLDQMQSLINRYGLADVEKALDWCKDQAELDKASKIP